jgi:hypothetical protein
MSWSYSGDSEGNQYFKVVKMNEMRKGQKVKKANEAGKPHVNIVEKPAVMGWKANEVEKVHELENKRRQAAGCE